MGFWPFYLCRKSLFDQLSAIGVDDVSIDKAAVFEFTGEQPLDNGQGFSSAQPHDADAALADGGGYGSDSILIHSK